MPSPRFRHAASADENEAALKANKYLIFSLKWVLGLAILIYLIRRVDFYNVFEAVAGANPRLLLFSLLLALIIRLLLAWQTVIVVNVLRVPLTVGGAFRINLTTAFYSLVLPGDLSTGAVRWYKLSQPTGQRIEVFAAIIFQRMVNTAFILVPGLFGLVIDAPFEQHGMLVTVVLSLISMILLFAFVFSNRLGESVEPWRIRMFQKIPTDFRLKLEKVWNTFISYRRIAKHRCLVVFLVATANTLLSIVIFKVTAVAMNLALPLATIIWIRSMVLLIQLLPASISGLGLREGALVILLPYYGIAPVDALCFSLILFGYTLFFSAIGGLIEAWETLRLKDA